MSVFGGSNTNEQVGDIPEWTKPYDEIEAPLHIDWGLQRGVSYAPNLMALSAMEPDTTITGFEGRISEGGSSSRRPFRGEYFVYEPTTTTADAMKIRGGSFDPHNPTWSAFDELTYGEVATSIADELDMLPNVALSAWTTKRENTAVDDIDRQIDSEALSGVDAVGEYNITRGRHQNRDSAINKIQYESIWDEFTSRLEGRGFFETEGMRNQLANRIRSVGRTGTLMTDKETDHRDIGKVNDFDLYRYFNALPYADEDWSDIGIVGRLDYEVDYSEFVDSDHPKSGLVITAEGVSYYLDKYGFKTQL
jgi:hypothetical protein